ncbi:hypothetical protein ScalyP_jg7947 [Parmales sp. scaly parma]|nr:hypothetical protein ScalyP_jg7947 [Parmales sp. scaly parma]
MLYTTLSRTALRPAARTAQRRFMGGDGHHKHMVFEPPFDRKVVGGVAIGILAAGFGVIWGGAKFQNKKHGFTWERYRAEN